MQSKSMRKKLILSGVILTVVVTVSAVWGHGWMAPEEAANINNPISKTTSSITNGKESFLDSCAACHGDDAKGLTIGATGLKKNTPNLRQRLQTHSDGDFFWKIKNGREQMPGFKDDLSEKEIWEIIHFLRETK